MAKEAVRQQAVTRKEITAVRGAANNPELARKNGVAVLDAEATKRSGGTCPGSAQAPLERGAVAPGNKVYKPRAEKTSAVASPSVEGPSSLPSAPIASKVTTAQGPTKTRVSELWEAQLLRLITFDHVRPRQAPQSAAEAPAPNDPRGSCCRAGDQR